jgi:hypothetical protein
MVILSISLCSWAIPDQFQIFFSYVHQYIRYSLKFTQTFCCLCKHAIYDLLKTRLCNRSNTIWQYLMDFIYIYIYILYSSDF